MTCNDIYSTTLARIPFGIFPWVCLLALSSVVSAQQTAYVGTTGVLSTPDALIASSGTLNYQYNNAMETRFLDEHTEGRNHVFALGLYPRFELGGRLTDFTPIGDRLSSLGTLNGKRDLSGNAKLNLYRIHDKLWVSMGALDFGGLSQNFDSRYAVATTRWKNLWVSAGIADGNNPSFDGGFANLHYKINPSLSFMAEVDTGGSANIGLSARIPLNKKLLLGSTISSNDDEVRAGLNVFYKLGSRKRHTDKFTEIASTAPPPKSSSISKASEADTARALSDLENSLAGTGFTNTRLGYLDDKHYVVSVENTVYMHSDPQAINQALKLSREKLPADSKIEIALQRHGLEKSRHVFSVNDHKESIQVIASTPAHADTFWSVSRHARGPQLAHFTLQPELRTAVGTEFGVIDYTLGVRSSMTVPLWPGASAVVAGILPLINSTNYDDGKPFANDRWEPSLERALFVQYVPMGKSAYGQLELGEVQVRNFFYTAVKAQAAWQSSRKPWLLHASAAQYRLKNSPTQRDVFLGSAHYTWPRLDTSISASYGQFFYGDQGIKLTASRRFDNTFASIFLKVISSDDLAGGLQISTPIGPRKAFSWRRLTFSGVSHWSHALQTTIKYPNVSDNRIQRGLLYEPLLMSEIPYSILDRGRLNVVDVSRAINAGLSP